MFYHITSTGVSCLILWKIIFQGGNWKIIERQTSNKARHHQSFAMFRGARLSTMALPRKASRQIKNTLLWYLPNKCFGIFVRWTQHPQRLPEKLAENGHTKIHSLSNVGKISSPYLKDTSDHHSPEQRNKFKVRNHQTLKMTTSCIAE